jgi:hypothetical protein
VYKLKLKICVREDLYKKKDPTMEDPHPPETSMRMSKLLMLDSAGHKARIFQLGLIGAFLQERTRSRVFIAFTKIDGEISPALKLQCIKPVLLVKAMYVMTLSETYWYE